MTCGIYKIENKVNNKVYIGQSINIEERLKTHERELKKGTHLNHKLQKDYDLYGHNFICNILLNCNEKILNYWEDYYLKQYDDNNIYNIATIPQTSSIIKNASYREKRTEHASVRMSKKTKDIIFNSTYNYSDALEEFATNLLEDNHLETEQCKDRNEENRFNTLLSRETKIIKKDNFIVTNIPSIFNEVFNINPHSKIKWLFDFDNKKIYLEAINEGVEEDVD